MSLIIPFPGTTSFIIPLSGHYVLYYFLSEHYCSYYYPPPPPPYPGIITLLSLSWLGVITCPIISIRALLALLISLWALLLCYRSNIIPVFQINPPLRPGLYTFLWEYILTRHLWTIDLDFIVNIYPLTLCSVIFHASTLISLRWWERTTTQLVGHSNTFIQQSASIHMSLFTKLHPILAI
jgi:hypothetical protein